MAKKGGVVPQMNSAVGRATLGQMPTGNTALPFTPAHVLGAQNTQNIANAVGAGGTGTWSAISPGQALNAVGGAGSSSPLTRPAYGPGAAGGAGWGTAGQQWGANADLSGTGAAAMAQMMRRQAR